MAVESISEQHSSEDEFPYESPRLTRFGTIEQWTLGMLDSGISISIVV